nr:unnamed protein product [Callosobruchus analis]
MRIGLLVSYIETEWSLSSVPFQKLLTIAYQTWTGFSGQAHFSNELLLKTTESEIGKYLGSTNSLGTLQLNARKFCKRFQIAKNPRIQPILNLPFFVDEPRLCVASTFVRYLNVTKGLKNWCDWL